MSKAPAGAKISMTKILIVAVLAFGATLGAFAGIVVAIVEGSKEHHISSDGSLTAKGTDTVVKTAPAMSSETHLSADMPDEMTQNLRHVFVHTGGDQDASDTLKLHVLGTMQTTKNGGRALTIVTAVGKIY